MMEEHERAPRSPQEVLPFLTTRALHVTDREKLSEPRRAIGADRSNLWGRACRYHQDDEVASARRRRRGLCRSVQSCRPLALPRSPSVRRTPRATPPVVREECERDDGWRHEPAARTAPQRSCWGSGSTPRHSIRAARGQIVRTRCEAGSSLRARPAGIVLPTSRADPWLRCRAVGTTPSRLLEEVRGYLEAVP